MDFVTGNKKHFDPDRGEIEKTNALEHSDPD
jgi:hypothetical protein